MKLPARPELGQKVQILLGILLGFLLLLFFSAEPPPIFGQGTFECKTVCEPIDPIITECRCETIDKCEARHQPGTCPDSSDLPEDCIGCMGKVCVLDGEFACISPCDCEPHRELQDCGPNARCVVGFCNPVGSVTGECKPIVNTCTEVGGVCCQTACDSDGPLEGSCITGVCCTRGCAAPEELPPACTKKCCPTPIGCIPINLTKAGEYLFCIMLDLVGLLALIMFVAGGYQVMAAGDDPKALEEGKSRMTSAILGFLAFLFFGWIIRSILGMEIIAFPIVCHI